MSRGPPPTKGFDIAMPIALMRGRVMLFQSLPDHVCNFTIAGNGIFALVRLMSATRLHATIAEITWNYSDAVAGLCTIPFGGPVSRELWLYSRYGVLRFFRVTVEGLEEIDHCGFSFVNAKAVTALPEIHDPNQLSSVQAVSLPRDPVPAVKAVTESPGTEPFDPGSPIICWLKKKNAGKKPGQDKSDPVVQKDPVSNSNCAHKKLAVIRNQIPGAAPTIPDSEPVAAGRTRLLCEGSSNGDQDHTPPTGGSGAEK
ncbi:MAG: hypothetical protein ABFC78_05760 [Methanoregula sp.]